MLLVQSAVLIELENVSIRISSTKLFSSERQSPGLKCYSKQMIALSYVRRQEIYCQI